jgi:hypothetical protein
MATGRTVEKHTRVYVSGYDLSGFSRAIGPLEITHEEADATAVMLDTVKGYLRNHTHVNLGGLDALLDNTATTGIHAALATSGQARTVIVAKGIQAAPAAGDPAFGGTFMHKGYQTEHPGGTVLLSCEWSGWASDASSLLYGAPWGVLLHANGAETGANSANSGIDNPEAGATAKGGYFVYQVLAGDGTATLSVDDSADNSSWTALSGATSGSVNCATRLAGVVAIGTAATVKRYLRWQLALGTATTVTFVSAFMRAF